MVNEMHITIVKRQLQVYSAATVLVLTAAPLTHAHAVLDQREARIGTSYKAAVKIGHGCDGSATTTVSVEIPEGVIAAKPMPKPGWTVTTERAAYARAYKHFHGDLTEGVRRIIWRGGPLPDDFYDEFVFSTFIARELAPATIYFPVTQTCEKGTLAWTDIPAEGQDGHDLAHPAAALKLVAATKAPDVTGSTASSTAIRVEQPWSRATPGGASVAAGYVKLTNMGKEADRLIGASFERAKSVELHAMTNDDGVMKMRQVEGGIELPPGGSVELKPGGLHLMMMGLSEGLKAGENVKGKLTFEKAGVVDITLAVAPLGADAPAAGGHEHHQH